MINQDSHEDSLQLGDAACHYTLIPPNIHHFALVGEGEAAISAFVSLWKEKMLPMWNSNSLEIYRGLNDFSQIGSFSMGYFLSQTRTAVANLQNNTIPVRIAYILQPNIHQPSQFATYGKITDGSHDIQRAYFTRKTFDDAVAWLHNT
jgi:hypothetical protein